MKPLTILLLSFTLLNCAEDDPISKPENPDTSPTAALMKEEVKQILISGNSDNVIRTIWKPSSAQLTNESGKIDVSNTPNIEDDEFIFLLGSQDGEMKIIWKPRNHVNINATSQDGALLDFYAPPIELTTELDNTSPKILKFEDEDGEIVVEVISEVEVNLQVRRKENSTNLSGKPKFHSRWSGWRPWCYTCYINYQVTPIPIENTVNSIPTSMQFSQLVAIDGSDLLFGAPGFTSSLATNKLYWSYRTNDNNLLEILKSYNLGNREIETCSSDINSFVSKQLHIIEGEIKVINGLHVNTYPTDLNPAGADPSCSPDSYEHGLRLSRFGSAVLDNSLYIFGGDLNETNSDKIYKYDDVNKSLTVIGTLPSQKSWANGEIVDSKLYVFGGQAQFSNTPSEDIIYVYDFDTASTKIFNLPRTVDRTYAARKDNLIYVAGQIDNTEYDIFFGVFNTTDNTFSEIPTNLDMSGNKTIHQLTVLNKTLYIIYGGADENGIESFGIYEAAL